MQGSDYESPDNSSETEWKISSVVCVMELDWETEEVKIQK
jgi:hypothetical protein